MQTISVLAKPDVNTEFLEFVNVENAGKNMHLEIRALAMCLVMTELVYLEVQFE